MEADYEFDAVVGTSAGALVGSLIVAGYHPQELRERVCRINWASLMDPGPIGGIPGIGKHLALVLRKGMYRGDVMEKVWSKLLAERGIHAFADIPSERLRMVATDLTHTRGIVLPNDLESYGIDPDRFPLPEPSGCRPPCRSSFSPSPSTIGERVMSPTLLTAGSPRSSPSKWRRWVRIRSSGSG
jgi:hypothetical protein